MRKFVLPENANVEAVSAVCQDGVLTVTVQKLPPPKPKKPRTIEVKVAQLRNQNEMKTDIVMALFFASSLLLVMRGDWCDTVMSCDAAF